MTFTDHVTAPAVPVADPQRIAADTFLIPNLVPAEPGTFVFVNSLVILAEQPVVVDTGAPLHRERWLDVVASVVDPADVRWVFLSHDDGDHLGNMADFLAMAPNATVVANFFTNERAALEPERALPIDRQVCRGLEAGTSFDAGIYHRHVDSIEAIGATTIATAHGPVLRGPFIGDAFDRARAMAGQPIVAPPGQETLDALVAQALADPAV